jgi:hypothetical protein
MSSQKQVRCWVSLPRRHYFFTSRTTDLLASDTKHNVMRRNNYWNPFIFLQLLLTLQIPKLLFKMHYPKDKYRCTNPSVPTLWTDAEDSRMYRRWSKTDRYVRYICYAPSYSIMQLRDVHIFSATAARTDSMWKMQCKHLEPCYPIHNIRREYTLCKKLQSVQKTTVKSWTARMFNYCFVRVIRKHYEWFYRCFLLHGTWFLHCTWHIYCCTP